MLGLKLPTDPRWVNIVETNISEILTDHAYCEQKAATNAINMVIQFPEYPDLVDAMLALAQEELQHFRQVHDKIQARGFRWGGSGKTIMSGSSTSLYGKDGSVTSFWSTVCSSPQWSKPEAVNDSGSCRSIFLTRICERFIGIS